MKNNQYIRQAQYKKGFANIILVGVIVVLIAIGVYFAFRKNLEPVAQQPIPTIAQTNTSTPTSKNETANWKICTNIKYGYEVKYPSTWKVWKTGAPEARLASCDENLASYSFAEDLFGMPLKNQINLMVFTRDNQVKEFWQGINSLDDYIKRMSAWKVQKETIISGERLIWLEYNQELQLVSYHNSAIYEFNISSMNSTTLDKFLASFKFTE